MRALLDRPGSRPSSWLTCGRFTAVILIAAMLAGCHARQRLDIPGVAPPRPDAASVQPGNHVKIKLRSGKIVSFTVAEVRSDQLVGTKGQQVDYQSMTRLERTHLAVGRTIVLVVGLALYLALGVAYSFASAPGL